MSNLSIGLVTSPSEESKQLISLLQSFGVQVTYHISPSEIQSLHIENEDLNVWLLNVDDDHWHDNIDQLLDESDASIYFNEPGTLSKQSHPDFWCQKLVNRLYELTGLTKDAADQPAVVQQEPEVRSTSPSEDSSLEYVAINEAESKDDLTSALDELETNSIGLPSDIAAELVSELESISPDLDVSIEDSINLDSELILEDDFSLQDEDILENEISEESDSMLNIESVELDTFDLNTTELDSLGSDNQSDKEPSRSVSEFSSNDIECTEAESTQISNEIMDLAEEQESKSAVTETSSEFLDEIDFSNSSIPVLESVRDDDEITLQSIYGQEEEETESSGDEVALATAKEYEQSQQDNQAAHQQLSDSLGDLETDLSVEDAESGIQTTEEFLQNQLQQENQEQVELELNLDIEDMVGELSFEEPEADEAVTGKANFMQEEPEQEQEEKISIIEEDNQTDGLQLTSINKEKTIGKAVFIQDDEEQVVEEKISITTEDVDGLSLQSIEAERTSGRAVFIEEEPEEQDIPIVVEQVLPSDGGLELESNGQNISTGKAEFIIDDEPLDAELDTADESLDDKTESDESIEKEFDFDLQELSASVEQETQHDVLENSTIETDLVPDITLDIEDTDVEDFLGLDEEIIEEQSLEFEIPMLDDAATGLDFDELIEQPTNVKLTPCWVIGASLGGPAAVKRFLQSLPADINASFIIAQHIDENFLPVLADILTSNSHFDVQVATGSNDIGAGKVYLAPLKGKLIFLKDGSMLVDHSQKWSGPYLPCIDDVIESLVSIYGEQSGAIIFSGMGQDGLKGVQKMQSLGGQVWAQSVDTCANASMPEAVINEGLASVVAAPEILADRLAKYITQ